MCISLRYVYICIYSIYGVMSKYSVTNNLNFDHINQKV